MEVFECKVCKYRTHVKCNFDKHFTTEKHKRNMQNVPVIPEPAVLKCKHCDKIFSHKQSLHRHENHRCKHNKTSQELTKLQAEVTDLQKLVQLLHLQLTQKDVLLDTKNDLIENLQKYNELKIN
jgi:uncharacterized C2H2 Zn-finger protein